MKIIASKVYGIMRYSNLSFVDKEFITAYLKYRIKMKFFEKEYYLENFMVELFND